MRDSMIVFMEICIDVKIFLQVSGFEVHYYEDGSYADFRVRNVIDPRRLCEKCAQLDFRILEVEGNLVIRIYEDYNEYGI